MNDIFQSEQATQSESDANSLMELWECYQKEKPAIWTATECALFKAYIHLVDTCIDDFAATSSLRVDRDLLYAAAENGLLEALRRHDPASDIPFEIRARHWMHWRMLRLVRNLIRAQDTSLIVCERPDQEESVCDTLKLDSSNRIELPAGWKREPSIRKLVGETGWPKIDRSALESYLARSSIRPNRSRATILFLADLHVDKHRSRNDFFDTFESCFEDGSSSDSNRTELFQIYLQALRKFSFRINAKHHSLLRNIFCESPSTRSSTDELWINSNLQFYKKAVSELIEQFKELEEHLGKAGDCCHFRKRQNNCSLEIKNISESELFFTWLASALKTGKIKEDLDETQAKRLREIFLVSYSMVIRAKGYINHCAFRPDSLTDYATYFCKLNDYEVRFKEKLAVPAFLMIIDQIKKIICIRKHLADRHHYHLILHEIGHSSLKHKAYSEYGLSAKRLEPETRKLFGSQEEEADLFASACLFLMLLLWNVDEMEESHANEVVESPSSPLPHPWYANAHEKQYKSLDVGLGQGDLINREKFISIINQMIVS